MPPERTPTQADVEANFRNSLDDIVAVAEKLLPFCHTVEDLIGMAKLATKNDGQLRLLMGMVAGKR